MNEIPQYLPLTAGIYLVLMVLFIHTNTTISTIMFKVIPVIIGMSCVIHSIKLLGWI